MHNYFLRNAQNNVDEPLPISKVLLWCDVSFEQFSHFGQLI